MNHLAMFCKYCEPGQVKSRWGAQIGDQKAADLAAAFQRHLAQTFARVGHERSLVFTPASRQAEFEQLSDGQWQLVPQSAGDLGDRMGHFMRQRLAHNERLVLIGSDSPDLPREFVELAFAKLATSPVVIGPAEDGGYYLLGASVWIPELFQAIPWSTPQVFQLTCERLAAQQIAYTLLPPWYDIDDQQSWGRFLNSVAQGAGTMREDWDELMQIMSRAPPSRTGASRV